MSNVFCGMSLLRLSIIVCLLLVTLSCISYSPSWAASRGTAQVNVSGQVGEYTLSLSGIIAPFANVTLVIDDNVIRSTVADSTGRFSISQVLVPRGLTAFCLNAIDVRRLGESYTCLTIPPLAGTLVKDDIFLPPTLGLQASEIAQGETATAWGYSMPNATVRVRFNGQVYTTTADSSGYYQISVPSVPAGRFELFADARYEAADSLNPQRGVELIALAITEQVRDRLNDFFTWLISLVIGSPWGILFVLLPLVGVIVYLLFKLNPQLGSAVSSGFSSVYAHIPFIPHRLHHSWMVGY